MSLILNYGNGTILVMSFKKLLHKLGVKDGPFLKFLGIIFVVKKVILLIIIAYAYFYSAEEITAERKPLPKFLRPVMFNTEKADEIMASVSIFPSDNPWHQDISSWPLLANSEKMVATVGNNGNLDYNLDMGYIIVPSDQPKKTAKLPNKGAERYSDMVPCPVPDNIPVEGWPLTSASKNLSAYQEMGENYQGVGGGDRHSLILDPVNMKLYEFYRMRRKGSTWFTDNVSVFDLNSNRLRYEYTKGKADSMGLTSTDAAGLPILPSVVRYDEIKRGKIDHALRFTIVNSRAGYVYPALHMASNKTNKDLPRMGERFRLKKEFDASSLSPAAQLIAEALKKYGMFMADNGGNWRVSIAPDDRIKGLNDIRKIKGSDFEVIDPSAYIPAEWKDGIDGYDKIRKAKKAKTAKTAEEGSEGKEGKEGKEAKE